MDAVARPHPPLTIPAFLRAAHCGAASYRPRKGYAGTHDGGNPREQTTTGPLSHREALTQDQADQPGWASQLETEVAQTGVIRGSRS